MQRYYDLWAETLKELEREVNEDTFSELFQSLTEIYKFDKGILYVICPYAFNKQRIEKYFKGTIDSILSKLAQEPIHLKLYTKEDIDNEIKQIEENNKVGIKPGELNATYTFKNFVVGDSNRFAFRTALKVACQPGMVANPLYIFGGVGLGKTQLMQAIGHQMLAEKPHAKVVYIQSETFVNDFINSIKNKTQAEFRNKYRNCDLLLVDDIQFFSKKEGIQEEFFHTFETLYNDQKQIVMTSDRLPTEIPELSERLVSRFAWGLQVEITPPDLETRIAILRKKAETDGLAIDDSTLDYIATQVDTNIRELEGALVKVQAHATIEREDINVDLAKEALADLKLVQKNRGLQISKIQEVVANYFQTSTTELKGKKRVKQIVVPRQIAMYLSRELTDSSLPKIGQEFGGKDHTTVMHACDKISRALKTDAEIKAAVYDLKAMLEH